jgi:hypothetical protein
MTRGFDFMPVGIENERVVAVCVAVRPRAGRNVVASTGQKSCSVKGIHGRTISSGEGDTVLHGIATADPEERFAGHALPDEIGSLEHIPSIPNRLVFHDATAM